MKKLMIMAVIAAAAGLCVDPTASTAAQLEGGLKFGVNIAFIHGSDVNSFPGYDSTWFMRFGLCGGGFVALPISGTVAIQAEALITTKGSHETGVLFDYPTYIYSLKITYLEIPILIRVLTPSFMKGGQIFFMAGPALALELGSRFMRSSEGISEVIPLGGLRSTDLGLVFSVGSVIRSKGYTEFRYTAGMSKMIEENGIPLDIKNGVFSVIVGWRF
jgi:hypothetical protein